jgi:ABC-type branched-subunit amino acid transport system ATPase component
MGHTPAGIITEGSNAALEVRGLSVDIGPATILDAVSFSVARGESIGIIGPNGSGKTSLFNCVCGFLPARAGEVLLEGRPVTNLSPASRALQGLGRVFQSPGIFREMTVLENMVTAVEARVPWHATLLPWGSGSREIEERSMQALKEVGLEAKAKSLAGSLSGGQLRLLEIVRAKSFGATVFLLDEPTAGVSPKMKETVAELIESLHAAGKTLLTIEHDMAFIERFTSRILVLDGGRLVLEGPPAQIRTSEELRAIYFGSRLPASA